MPVSDPSRDRHPGVVRVGGAEDDLHRSRVVLREDALEVVLEPFLETLEGLEERDGRKLFPVDRRRRREADVVPRADEADAEEEEGSHGDGEEHPCDDGEHSGPKMARGPGPGNNGGRRKGTDYNLLHLRRGVAAQKQPLRHVRCSISHASRQPPYGSSQRRMHVCQPGSQTPLH